MKKTKNTVATPSRLEKRLQAEIDGLKKLVDENAAARDHHARSFKAALDQLMTQDKDMRQQLYQIQKLGAELDYLRAENARLAQANGISAEGMIIERNELQTRARRLDMRIQGLVGPNVA